VPDDTEFLVGRGGPAHFIAYNTSSPFLDDRTPCWKTESPKQGEIMKLYYNPVSTFAQKAMLGMYEKNIKFEPMLVDLMNPEKKAEYKKVYPLGKVPCLIRDDGWMIPESTIILEYIDGAFTTGTQLIPTDKDLARQTRFHDRMADLYVNEPVSVLFFAGMRPPEEQKQSFFQERMKRMKDTLDIVYPQIDKNLDKKTWLMGNAFTMADCALIPALGYARMVYPFETFKNLNSYFNRAVERPSYKKVMDEATPMLKAFKK
jgi:glutathione S-transferase